MGWFGPDGSCGCCDTCPSLPCYEGSIATGESQVISSITFELQDIPDPLVMWALRYTYNDFTETYNYEWNRVTIESGTDSGEMLPGPSELNGTYLFELEEIEIPQGCRYRGGGNSIALRTLSNEADVTSPDPFFFLPNVGTGFSSRCLVSYDTYSLDANNCPQGPAVASIGRAMTLYLSFVIGHPGPVSTAGGDRPGMLHTIQARISDAVPGNPGSYASILPSWERSPYNSCGESSLSWSDEAPEGNINGWLDVYPPQSECSAYSDGSVLATGTATSA